MWALEENDTVALHPQCKAFLDQLASMGGKPMHEMTPAEARGLALPPELAGPERADAQRGESHGARACGPNPRPHLHADGGLHVSLA